MNRLDGDDKEYGYIIDYKDLFKSLEGAVHDYTSGALDGYDKEDVAGLLEDRLEKGPGAAGGGAGGGQGAVRAGRSRPGITAAYLRYFCAKDSGNAEQLKANEPNRLALYKLRRRAGARLRQPGQRDGGGRLHRQPRSQRSRRRWTTTRRSATR